MSESLKKSLCVESLTLEIGRRVVLWETSFSLSEGMLCGVIGPNGAGKSSLLKALMGLMPKACGAIERNGSLAYVPQREEVDWDFPVTVRDVAMMGRFKKMGFFKWTRAADRLAADRVLEEMGLSDVANRQISELSGGQQQRVFLARAILQDADIYLLDEPFSGIDHTTEKMLVELFKSWKKQKKTILVVHHNLNNAPDIFDHLLLLNGRVVGFGPTSEVFTEEMLAKTYGNASSLLKEMLTLFEKKKSGTMK